MLSHQWAYHDRRRVFPNIRQNLAVSTNDLLDLCGSTATLIPDQRRQNDKAKDPRRQPLLVAGQDASSGKYSQFREARPEVVNAVAYLNVLAPDSVVPVASDQSDSASSQGLSSSRCHKRARRRPLLRRSPVSIRAKFGERLRILNITHRGDDLGALADIASKRKASRRMQ